MIAKKPIVGSRDYHQQKKATLRDQMTNRQTRWEVQMRESLTSRLKKAEEASKYYQKLNSDYSKDRMRMYMEIEEAHERRRRIERQRDQALTALQWYVENNTGGPAAELIASFVAKRFTGDQSEETSANVF